jgi:hypothetical protein
MAVKEQKGTPISHDIIILIMRCNRKSMQIKVGPAAPPPFTQPLSTYYVSYT